MICYKSKKVGAFYSADAYFTTVEKKNGNIISEKVKEGTDSTYLSIENFINIDIGYICVGYDVFFIDTTIYRLKILELNQQFEIVRDVTIPMDISILDNYYSGAYLSKEDIYIYEKLFYYS